MNHQKDDHSVTGSPLMCVEFIIIQTIIWGFALCVLFYFLNLFLLRPLFSDTGIFFLMPFFYYVLRLFEWPGVMLTALVITVIRCILRRTTVTLSGDTVIISRMRHTDCLPLADFVRPKTVESYVSIHFVGWIFRRRYLIFRNDAGKETNYRLYEYSEKDLEQALQLLTRVSRAEHLEEDIRTKMLMNAFQYETEILLDPKQLWRRMAGRMAILSVFSLAAFLVFICLFYKMLFLSLLRNFGFVPAQIAGYGSVLISLISLLLLFRSLWTLAVNAVLKTSCPQRIAFVGNMLQIDQTLYSVNRIQQVIMNPPDRKLPLFSHYRITVVTTDGTRKYWLGTSAGLDPDTWPKLCRNMQELLISCPAKLFYR